MKFLLVLCLCCIFLNRITEATMSEKQLKAAVKLVRNMCQPKSKATNEDIDKMHQGEWDIDHTAMCYMHCALNSQKLINKENVLNFDYAITLAEKNLPTTIKDASIESATKCKDAAKTLDDSCVAAYEIAKCFYEANPAIYFLP